MDLKNGLILGDRSVWILEPTREQSRREQQQANDLYFPQDCDRDRRRPLQQVVVGDIVSKSHEATQHDDHGHALLICLHV